ncbi:MAG: RnfABCDGE type electron transport complex subunit D [Firmicutes bacterium]|nr:RnfABCDGE type electron transport complex subunit D [Bacillota bacterium]
MKSLGDNPAATRRIMIDVLIALAPCAAAAVLFFGYHVAVNLVVCAGACFGAELLFNLIVKGFKKENVKKSSCTDFSCLVTAAVLALLLPAKAAVKGWDLNFYADGFRTGGGVNNILFSFDILILCILGSIFAIGLVKMLFGGIAQNLLNPAGAARLFLFVCFALTAVQAAVPGLTATSGATWLSGDKATDEPAALMQLFLGNRGAAGAGETSMIAIIIGYIYLSVRRVIDFRLPLIGLGCFMLFILIFDGMIAQSLLFWADTPQRLANNVFANVLSGGFVFCLVFMASDKATTPSTFWGGVIFVAGFGLLTALLRAFSVWSEGAIFALLAMNLTAPLLRLRERKHSCQWSVVSGQLKEDENPSALAENYKLKTDNSSSTENCQLKTDNSPSTDHCTLATDHCTKGVSV